MLKPIEPFTELGQPLGDEDAWSNEFARGYYELCEGQVDLDFVCELAAQLFPSAAALEPRKVAELATIIVAFDMPD